MHQTKGVGIPSSTNILFVIYKKESDHISSQFLAELKERGQGNTATHIIV